MKPKYKSLRGEFTDDWGINCSELRVLPISEDSSALCSFVSYKREIEFRMGRIKEGITEDLPKWEDLKIYNAE
jgi:hypothetical protein